MIGAGAANLQVPKASPTEYERQLMAHSTGVCCRIDFIPSGVDGRPDDDFIRMPITRQHQSIAYRDENSSSVRYRTATHMLTMPDESDGGSKIYLACRDDGTVEIYAMPDSGRFAMPISEIRVADHIVDPITAMLYDDVIYIVANIPSEQAIARGVNARMPSTGKRSDGASLPTIYTAYGCLNLLACDLPRRKSSIILRSDGDYEPYYLFVAPNASGAPSLMVLNLALGDNGENMNGDDTGLGFHSLFNRVINDNHDKPEKPRSEWAMPVGLSAFDIPDGHGFAEVPMAGDPGRGIMGVSFNGGGGMDSVLLVVAGDRGGERAAACRDKGAATNKAPEGND